jgi:putative NADH-flavin reductase
VVKLAIFGATGGTGGHLVRQALQAGHEVTAVVRDPARLPAEAHPRLAVVRADISDPGAVAAAVTGRDAVVSALGSRDARKPTTVCTDGARSIIQAMQEAGTVRLIVVSASGLAAGDDDGPLTRLVVKPILQAVFRHPFADMRGMEEEVRGSGLEWTIVRPPRLTDGPHTGVYRSAVDRNVRGGFRISRADLADCILRLLNDPDSVRSVISIGS